MGFWIFMMVLNLLIPFTMIGFGKYFIKNAPKEINYVFGYRTSMSMKNEDTWVFAHHYCGKVWLILGSIILIPSAIAMLFVIGKDANTVGTFSLILCSIQLIFLVGSIFPTERALKSNFDEQGR
ncbi:SdpI family protein [Desulfosporosinus sp. SB140]|uniref:SdpI family protein n=1 Tax=Desulfosporosinus paludis TaxID=3115649 RepID=UPI00388DB72C